MTTPIDVILRFIKTGQGDEQTIKALKDLERGTDGAAKGIKDVGSQSAKTDQSVQSLAKSYAKFAAGAAAVVAAGKVVVDFQKENIRLAGIQEDAERQLAQTIQSTGGAAGLTATELKGMASALQGVTKFGDEAIIGGQSLLLTFTNIGKDVFPRATETMLDMSQALGQDMKSSAIQLGKALNDPITGVSALQRVGVSFTAQQKEQIKTMTESGQVMEAQTLILDELSRQFGGSAAAAAETYTGKIEQLGNTWGDLREQMGFALRLTGEQVDGTKNLVGATTEYLALSNRLKDEHQAGNITLYERWAALKEVEFTTKTAGEALAEYAAADMEAEKAALAFTVRAEKQALAMQVGVRIANEATQATIEYSAAAAAAAGPNEDLADKTQMLGNHMTEAESSIARVNLVTAQNKAANEAAVQATEAAAEAAREAAEAYREQQAALGGYFDTALKAGEGAETLQEQLYSQAAAAGAGATEMAILAAATGNYTDAEIEAAFQAALMTEQIKILAQQVAAGALSADDAVAALKRLQEGTADSAAEASNLVAQAGAIQTGLDGVSGAAIDAAANLGAIPTDLKVHIGITSDPIPALPNMPGGQKTAAFADGGLISGGTAVTGYGMDNVMIAARTGEYVLKPSAVNKLGLNRLNYMNSTGRLPGYAEGGYIGGDGGGSMSGASVMFAPVIQVSGVVSRQQGIESGRNILDGLVDAARGRGVRI